MKKIMKFLDVIYYNFYLYYKNQKVHYIDPELMPCVSVSNTLNFMLMGLMILLDIDNYFSIFTIFIIIYLGSYLYYIRNNRYLIILKKKPMIKSKRFSKFMTITFFVLMLLLLFGSFLVAAIRRDGDIIWF